MVADLSAARRSSSLTPMAPGPSSITVARRTSLACVWVSKIVALCIDWRLSHLKKSRIGYLSDRRLSKQGSPDKVSCVLPFQLKGELWLGAVVYQLPDEFLALSLGHAHNPLGMGGKIEHFATVRPGLHQFLVRRRLACPFFRGGRREKCRRSQLARVPQTRDISVSDSVIGDLEAVLTHVPRPDLQC